MSATATVHTEALGPAGAAPLPCQVVVIEGPDAGRAVELGPGETVIGSDPGCDLPLTDPAVSRRHLSVRRDGDRFAVRDLDSRNHTLYEGGRLGAASLPVGATLKLGHTFVRLQPRPQPLVLTPSRARRMGELVAESLAMREVFAVLELAADGDVSVLLEGETGVGKELAARALHDVGARRRGRFVAIDCGALPETLLESELFGHVRGAFTGASAARAGAFVRADGGTIFLDELDTISGAVQARLLRVLEQRRVRAVGADDETAIDVRVVAAARRDLRALVAEGSFRADLYYRLSVVRVVLPPLRERREDVAPIVGELLRLRGLAEPGPIAGPNLDRLLAHEWPGNARELRNAIDRALALSPGATRFDGLRLALDGDVGQREALVVRDELPFAAAKQAVVDEFERRYLRALFDRNDGNISAAAREADLDRKHLRVLLVRHGILAAP
ncbi:MAG: sigma 54-interacting transcriptional regulator [Deltaproteobacteria bacterium]|nr:sigma 54-interacting transcriptional regulator [Deltaproteobacteria bacterium]